MTSLMRLGVGLGVAVALCACQAPAATTTAPTTAPATTPTTAASTQSSPATTSARPSSAKASSATATPSRTSSRAATASPAGSGSPYAEATRLEPLAHAYQDYWAAVDDMRNAGGADAATEAMKATMAGDALSYWTKVAQQWKEVGVYSVGRYQVVYADQEQVALTATGGTAKIRYCVDASGGTFHTRNSADTPPPKPPERYRTGLATMEWLDGSWKLTAAKETNSNSC